MGNYFKEALDKIRRVPTLCLADEVQRQVLSSVIVMGSTITVNAVKDPTPEQLRETVDAFKTMIRMSLTLTYPKWVKDEIIKIRDNLLPRISNYRPGEDYTQTVQMCTYSFVFGTLHILEDLQEYQKKKGKAPQMWG